MNPVTDFSSGGGVQAEILLSAGWYGRDMVRKRVGVSGMACYAGLTELVSKELMGMIICPPLLRLDAPVHPITGEQGNEFL